MQLSACRPMSNFSAIVSGGGWKHACVENVKVKAWIKLFLTIVLGSVAVAGPDWLSLYIFILAVLNLSLSVLFFFREKPRPTVFPSGRSGTDLRKLYGDSANGTKKP